MAFGKPPVKPKPEVNTYSGRNGALAAATRSTTTSRDKSTASLDNSGDSDQLVYQRTGESSNNGSAIDFGRRMISPDRTNGLLHPQDQTKSASFIAATIAASRSVTPNHTGQSQQMAPLRRRSSFTQRPSPSSVRSLSSRSSLDRLDTTSIPPTTSLIGMFERQAPPITTHQPIPQRPIPATTSNVPTKPIPPTARIPPSRSEKKQRPEIKSPKPTRSPSTIKRVLEAPVVLPKPRKPAKITNATSNRESEPPKQLQAVRSHSIPASKPIPIPSKTRPRKEVVYDSASSNDSFVSATEYKPSLRASINDQNRLLSTASAQSHNSSAAVDSLANAIVASSLASSRAASPSRKSYLSPPPPPPSRRHHLFHTSSNEISRTPSPGKPVEFRTTMRKPKDDEDESEKKRRSRKNLMKKHPNKHHEGDRKRWRNEVTERERKRYEAVWASNKGLFTGPGYENEVSSLVARDIFSRSRLHRDVLEEVYVLIDRQGNGMLHKEEFVVGLWLIDQRLKGRKLPIRVTDSVWWSVGIMRGIKVKKAGK